MKFPKGTPIDWSWLDIAPADMAAVEVGDLKTPTKDLPMGSQKITGLAEPTALGGAATKGYVDSKVQGLSWQEPVISKLADPPGTPAEGDRHIVIATATGDWAGHEDDIAQWNGTSWDFTTPSEGFALRVTDTDIQEVFNGTAWVPFGSTINHANITNVLADQHHPQDHTLGSHSTKDHAELTEVTPDQHHPQAHTLGSHSTKAHGELTDITTDQHHAKTGNYEVFPNTELVTGVPAPVAGNVGRILRERTGAGQVTKVFLCVENSADTYEWVQIGIST
ncbi:hypothetical protein ES703_88059 [subsurface metagenome]